MAAGVVALKTFSLDKFDASLTQNVLVFWKERWPRRGDKFFRYLVSDGA
jgi:hypothetical protein